MKSTLFQSTLEFVKQVLQVNIVKHITYFWGYSKEITCCEIRITTQDTADSCMDISETKIMDDLEVKILANCLTQTVLAHSEEKKKRCLVEHVILTQRVPKTEIMPKAKSSNLVKNWLTSSATVAWNRRQFSDSKISQHARQQCLPVEEAAGKN